MTQEAPRCQHPSDYVRNKRCNRTLVSVEGPCVTCGRSEFLESMRLRGHGDRYGHAYASPRACPVHSAAPDRGEA